jgi:hypothetical protein
MLSARDEPFPVEQPGHHQAGGAIDRQQDAVQGGAVA